MKRRQIILGAALFVTVGLVAGGAMAADPVAVTLRALEREGYRIVTTKRTLLGRMRIVATRHGLTREVVIDPRTGEVLRDLSRQPSERGDGSTRESRTSSSGSGSSSSGSSSSGRDSDSSDDSDHDDSEHDGSDHDSDHDSDSDDSGHDDSHDSED